MAPRTTTQNAGETATVVAHGLLTSMAVVTAGTMTLWEHWSDLSPEKRDYLFERILAHAELVGDGLRDLAQGLPDAVAAELAANARHRQARH
ncbi:MAG: hypothetical protein JO050_10335 [Acidimicrobiia bacterium]|nr:hypothetical protein [Acidimicrobiia bacterium]